MRVLFVTVLFLLPSLASAQILFNEIASSPAHERFIELYNSGDTDIDLTGWYIQRKTATGSTFGSLVASTKFENKIISAHGYFLIARSALPDADIILDTLSLTESNTLHLKNPEREIVDQIVWATIDEGKSYQKLSAGEWVVGQRTPRAQNSERGETASLVATEERVATSVVIGAPAVSGDQKIALDIGPQERIVLVGLPATFEGHIEGADKKPISGTQMKWSFGDGAVAEGWGITSVSHTYHYPGEYSVLLHLPAFFVTSPRVRVRVIEPELALHVEGHYGRTAVVIENRMNDDLDITGWQLFAGGKTFRFPMTIIGAKKRVAFPSEITFLGATAGVLPELFYPNGARVPLVQPNTQHTSSTTPLAVSAPAVDDRIFPAKEKINSHTKSAVATNESAPLAPMQQARLVDAIEDVVAQSDHTFEKQNETAWVWYVSIFFLSALAFAGFLLVTSKNTLADEFEIIEEKEAR